MNHYAIVNSNEVENFEIFSMKVEKGSIRNPINMVYNQFVDLFRLYSVENMLIPVVGHYCLQQNGIVQIKVYYDKVCRGLRLFILDSVCLPFIRYCHFIKTCQINEEESLPI